MGTFRFIGKETTNWMQMDFNIKCKQDGNTNRYKARLVAKGFTQTYNIDYQETFAPTTKLNV